MRVIGGEFRSRVLKSLPGLDTRPTPDRMRETLFDILAPRIQGIVFADLYAGTGAVGIEALSRGAKRAVFVESHRPAVNVIRDNLYSLGVESRAAVLQAKVGAVLAKVSAEIVFLDPPYRLEEEYQKTLSGLSDSAPTLVIAQHDARLMLQDAYGRLGRVRLLKQGDNALSFYEPAAI